MKKNKGDGSIFLDFAIAKFRRGLKNRTVPMLFRGILGIGVEILYTLVVMFSAFLICLLLTFY